jgi:hypothetical protein
VAVKVDERVMRAVADPVRVPAGDFVPVGDPDVVFVEVVVALDEVDGEPETVSTTVGVADIELVTVFVSVAEPVVVRVVLTLLDVVADAVGETV